MRRLGGLCAEIMFAAGAAVPRLEAGSLLVAARGLHRNVGTPRCCSPVLLHPRALNGASRACMRRPERLPAAMPRVQPLQLHLRQRRVCTALSSSAAAVDTLTDPTAAAAAASEAGPDTKSYSLVTFYCFSPIDDPNAEVRKHKEFCQVRLQLVGTRRLSSSF